MSAIYYSIYVFYTKLIKEIEVPHFYCSILISLLETINIFSLANLYLLNYNLENINYSFYYPISTTAFLFVVNWFYFKKRKDFILSKYSEKTKLNKLFLMMITILFIAITLFFFFYFGYQIRKLNLTGQI